MKKSLLLLLLGVMVLVGCQRVSQEVLQPKAQDVTLAEEYCFYISETETIGMKKVKTSPSEFLSENSQVIAAINGVYYGKDYRTGEHESLGVAYLSGEGNLANRQGDIRGYLSIDQTGEVVSVSERFEGAYDAYLFVLGTHPLLVQSHDVHPQAQEKRYNFDSFGEKKEEYRSAVGTKDGSNVCFAVSTQAMTIYDWALRLIQQGYKDAINLDGGFESQLAVRGKGSTGIGADTRLIIYSYKR